MHCTLNLSIHQAAWPDFAMAERLGLGMAERAGFVGPQRDSCRACGPFYKALRVRCFSVVVILPAVCRTTLSTDFGNIFKSF